MSAGARTATTLLVLVGLLVAALAWGWSAATSPLPESTEPDACSLVGISAGEKVYPDQVLVSVLNAGERSGLAGRTMQLLTDEGFAAGNRGNAPARSGVETAEIWTDDPDSPSVRLVASWLGKGIEIRDEPATAEGVVVVVGDKFQDLAAGRKAVKAKTDTTICVPPSDVEEPEDELVTP